MTYSAPIDDIAFSLMHEAGFARLIEGGKYPELSAELTRSILSEAGKFAENIVAPISALGDRVGAQLTDDGVRVPPEFCNAYRQYVAAGWGTLAAPTEYGGQGLPLALANAVTEMMNANIAFQLCPMLTQGGVEALTAHGSDALKKTYLPKIISGEWSATMNLTEPQAGSDVGAITARATPQADGSYRITGTKIFITHGDHNMAENIIHFVLARTPDAPDGTKGISLFLVPKFIPDADGALRAANDVRCIGLEEKLGIHASPTCVMAYGEQGGAQGWLVGEEQSGMACMFTMMNNARLHVGLQGVGVAERATQHALAYARARKQGRVAGEKDSAAIVAHPDVRRMLLTMRALTDAARAICYENAVAADMAQSQNDARARARNDLLTPISKAFSTDIANEVAALGVQVHGGMGFIEETGAAQHIRDARILTIYEGTNGIQAIDLVGRKLAMHAAVADYLGEIADSAAKARQSNEPELVDIAERLDAALTALKQATQWIGEAAPRDRLAGASDYLRLFALTAGGHYLTRGALASSDMDTPLAAQKRAVARFFASNLLVSASGLAQAVMAGASALDAAELDT